VKNQARRQFLKKKNIDEEKGNGAFLFGHVKGPTESGGEKITQHAQNIKGKVSGG